MEEESIEFKGPQTKSEWADYHRIREQLLFIERGKIDVYRVDHPDEFLENNFPRILIVNEQVVGVIRVDIDHQSREAGFRLVAIIPELQGIGYGSKMMKLAEEFASDFGVELFSANSAKEAVGFYQSMGYQLDPSHPTNNPDYPRVAKVNLR